MFLWFRNRWSEFRQDCAGIAAVEMALIVVGIFAMTPLIVDFASIVAASEALGGGLRAGVQLAVIQPTNTSGISTTVKTASGFPANDVTVSTAEFCECSGVSATCGVACYSGANPYKYIRVTASYPVPVLLPYSGFGVSGSTYSVSKAVTVRTQ